MANRQFWVATVPVGVLPLVALLASGGIQGCSSIDPGEVHPVAHDGLGTGPGAGNGGGGLGDNPGGSTGGGDTTGGGSTGGGGGGGGGGDGGGGGGGGGDGGTVVLANNAFTGAPAFVQATGTATNSANGKTDHSFGGADPSNPFGQNCMDCHGTGGGASTKFAAGGSVVKTGTTPAPSVEVVLRNTTSNAVVVTHTDTLGNFFFPIAQGPVGAGWQVGVRDGTANGSSPMPDPLAAANAGGGCSAAGTCHGGAQGKVHVP